MYFRYRSNEKKKERKFVRPFFTQISPCDHSNLQAGLHCCWTIPSLIFLLFAFLFLLLC
jgi:hypothetical protein